MRITNKILEEKINFINKLIDNTDLDHENEYLTMTHAPSYGGYDISNHKGAHTIMERRSAKEAYSFLMGILHNFG